jgi:AcrR family transcriptional regulator
VKVRTEARREQILGTAAQVFLEHGYRRASMSQIAQRLGGSKATLYGYFASKEALFVAVIQAEAKRHLETAEDELANLTEGQLQLTLIRFGEALVRFLCSDLACSAFRMVMAEAGQSDIGRMYYEGGPLQGTKKIAAALKSAMARGELREADPWVAAQQLGGLLTCEVQPRWYFKDNEPMSPGQARGIAERAVDVFMRAYAPLAQGQRRSS